MRSELPVFRAVHVLDGADVRPSVTVLVADGAIHDVDFTGAMPPQR